MKIKKSSEKNGFPTGSRRNPLTGPPPALNTIIVALPYNAYPAATNKFNDYNYSIYQLKSKKNQSINLPIFRPGCNASLIAGGLLLSF